jgi:hypothetical protein
MRWLFKPILQLVYNMAMLHTVLNNLSALPSPGMVYVMVSDFKPGLVKIGFAAREDLRSKSGKTWLGDLQVVVAVPFMFASQAEAQLKRHFSDKLADASEWFAVSVAQARDEIARLFALQAPYAQAFGAVAQQCADLGLMARPAGVPATSIEALLDWKLPRQSVSVQTACRAALSGTPGSHVYGDMLEKAGFTLVLSDGLVLLNFKENALNTRFLDKTVGRGRWESSFKGIAGFDAAASSVTIAKWTRTSRLSKLQITQLLNDPSRRLIHSPQ